MCKKIILGNNEVIKGQRKGLMGRRVGENHKRAAVGEAEQLTQTGWYE